MSRGVGRPLTIGMGVKTLACWVAVSRLTAGVRWDGANVERLQTAGGQTARVMTAAAEIERVLRILEGEDPPVPDG